MLEPTYSRIARNYDDMYSEPSDLEEDKELFGLLREHLTGKVLDIGAGTGLLLDNIDIPIEDYFGIDQSAEMLVVLDKKHPERKIMATDFEGFVGIIGDFDTVVALYGVASYIRPDYLTKVKEIISKDGKFFLMFYKPDYYPRFYTDKELEWESTIDLVKKVMYREDVEPMWLQIPFKLFNATSGEEQ